MRAQLLVPSGLSAGVDGGGAPGDALTVFSSGSGVVSQATNPNSKNILVGAPADGLYQVHIVVTLTAAGIGVGFLIVTSTTTDPLGNVQNSNYGGPNDTAAGNSFLGPIDFYVKKGTDIVMGFNFDDPGAVADYFFTVTRVG